MIEYLVGLDLGQANDYTALCVIERAPTRPATYALRHLERPVLGTPYPAIAARVKTLTEAAPLVGRCVVVVDATGVGAPVVDLLRAARLPLVPVSITGGDTVTRDAAGAWRVPKRDLVFSLLTALQTGRLKIADGLPLAPVLVGELLNFRVKIDPQTAHDSYAAWREGAHDDLVLSAALALWYGANEPRAVPAILAQGTARWPRRRAGRDHTVTQADDLRDPRIWRP